MKLAILAGVLMVLGLAGILVCTILRVHQHYDPPERIDYGVILDAGSTATKAYIYQWSHKTSNAVPAVGLSLHNSAPLYYRLAPGIGTLAPNYTAVDPYLGPIIAWAKDNIPHDSISTTPIYFQGTGGLRQLSETSSAAMLYNVRKTLMDSGFLFDTSYASILSGTNEAGYGFVAVNALYDRFATAGDVQPDTYGSLDLGGVSSEIAYIDQGAHNFTININSTDFSVYTLSSDLLGINSARYAYNASLFLINTSTSVIDPCAPFGYYENVTIPVDGILRSFMLIGSSNAELCQAQVRNFVQSLTQSLPKPNVGDDDTFVLADHYVKAKDFYKLKDNANLVELQAKTTSFCGLNYGDSMAHHKKFVGEVQNYCFNGFYIVSLLEDYYGFNPTRRHLLWKNSVNKSPITWTLGSVIAQVSGQTPDTKPVNTKHWVRFFRTDGGTVALFISVLLVVLGFVLFILQRRRPTDYVIIS